MIVGRIILVLFVLGFLFLVFCAITSLRRIPFSYMLGNLKARRISTAMSILGIGVVIAVMLSMMALDNGVTKTTVTSRPKTNLTITPDVPQPAPAVFVTH